MSPLDAGPLNQSSLRREERPRRAGRAPGAVDRLVARFTGGLNLCGSLLIVVVMALVGADVLGRDLFDEPISGVTEIVCLSILGIVFLQAPQALRQGRFARSDTLIDFLAERAPRAARVLETVYDCLGAAVFGVILYGTLPLLIDAWVDEEFVGSVGDFTAPVWPVKAAIAIGSAALVANFVLRAIRRWRPGHGAV